MGRRKIINGYTIDDIKVGMKIREKDSEEGEYGIITNIDDVHDIQTKIYNSNGKQIGNGSYCFDKSCKYEYYGGKIEIIQEKISD